ncbi:YbaN family protein [Bacillus tianshenii]|nr:YbaN family protein [Bacillus tianshenii]
MRNLYKYILIGIGYLSIALGVVGIVLPLIPTTPLLLLGAYCLFKSSPRLYEKLMNHKLLGGYIKRWRSGEGIPLKSKIIVIALLWLAIGYSVAFMIPLLFVKILLLGIASTVTIYLIKMKSAN